MSTTLLFIGVMSGSSLDGIDVALTELPVSNRPNSNCSDSSCKVIATHFQPYDISIKNSLLALHFPQESELESAALMANQLARLYAEAVNALLSKYNINPNQISAIGCHGQTVRHQPRYKDDVGYTIQLGNNALLAELTNITVVGDFRSRDIAAGGQGAPLVPAFHQAVFGRTDKNRAIVNIGGIANITYLAKTGEVLGFDSGPGNMLLDSWVKQNLGKDYDAHGEWASTGVVHESLLSAMLTEPYFSEAPPKSTGRDLFNDAWLKQYILPQNGQPQDVARTLVALTAHTINQAIKMHCPAVDEVYLCGGGAHNSLLVKDLNALLDTTVANTDVLGVGVDWVEAVAFAWLAKQTLENKPSNLPNVTGALAPRILGAIFPH
ncbi:MAG: anhydro-N-acetylmuramic acid kinase [Methylophilaceae bacterium]